MSKMDQNTHLFDKPANVKRLLNGFYAICIILTIADFVVHRHITMGWEKIPGFYAIYGFVACVVLVLIAKKMRKVVMRKENYYDE
ncbi:MAG: hypothetical protein KZQ90_05180 [Candidatus Thiodiazotropha sp. (ex Codakia rugifera)]|nr:hypothetical protein [Candidatus Thiodiazotropha sp. (ex Codakia rugifera)]